MPSFLHYSNSRTLSPHSQRVTCQDQTSHPFPHWLRSLPACQHASTAVAAAAAAAAACCRITAFSLARHTIGAPLTPHLALLTPALSPPA